MFTKVLLAAACLITLGACRSGDPLLIDSAEAIPARESEPAPFSVGIMPCTYSVAPAAAEEAGALYGTGEELSKALADALLEMKVASRVEPLQTDIKPEQLAAFDLVITPSVLSDSWNFEKTNSGRAGLSTLAWFGTWFGGLMVDDKKYSTEVKLKYTIKDTRNTPRPSLNGISGQQQLTFLDRNGFASGWTLLTLICPPFLTGSNQDKTKESLQKGAAQQLAARLKGDLKTILTRGRGGKSYIIRGQPTNGSVISAGTSSVTCSVEWEGDVQLGGFSVNGEPQGEDSWRIEGTGATSEQSHEHRIRLQLPQPKRGRNDLRLDLVVDGSAQQHTLCYYVE